MGTRAPQSPEVKIAIKAFSYTVGVIIFVLVDKWTGWIGLFN